MSDAEMRRTHPEPEPGDGSGISDYAAPPSPTGRGVGGEGGGGEARGWYLPEVLKGLGITFKHVLADDATIQYPEEVHAPRPGYRGEHRLKRDEMGRPKCVACQLCSTACPAQCIHIVATEAPWDDRDKVPKVFEIDLLRCIYCGLCEEACPCDAIELTSRYNQTGTRREEFVHDLERLLGA